MMTLMSRQAMTNSLLITSQKHKYIIHIKVSKALRGFPLPPLVSMLSLFKTSTCSLTGVKDSIVWILCFHNVMIIHKMIHLICMTLYYTSTLCVHIQEIGGGL